MEEGSSEEVISSACQRLSARQLVNLSEDVGRFLGSGGQDLAVEAGSGLCHQGEF